jgi:hypothetical protein
METSLLVWTDPAVRRALLTDRPGRLVLATDDASPEDRAGYDAVVDLPPVDDVEGTLAVLRRTPFDRVFFQTEFGLLAGSLLARERGIPGPSPESVLATLDKATTRARLSRAGVPQPRFVVARDAAGVRAAGLGIPLVLKARASTLGRLVTKVERDADLDDAVLRLTSRLPTSPDVRRLVAFARAAGLSLAGDPTKDFLAESFAEGPALEADGLVMEGFGDLFGITEQVVRDGDGFYIEGYAFPADEPGRLPVIARAAVEALGLDETGFSIEFRGESVIEVNGRLGEDDGFPDLFRAGMGTFPVVKQLLRRGGPTVVRGRHALAYVNRYAAGVVRRVVEVPGTTVVVSEGQRLYDPWEPAYRAHVAYALGSHETSSRAALAAAREKLRGVQVVVEAGASAAERERQERR